jgi:hypothetical protein
LFIISRAPGNIKGNTRISRTIPVHEKGTIINGRKGRNSSILAVAQGLEL